MTARVIQGFFRGGQPKLAASIQPRIAAPPISLKTAAPAPSTAFSGRSPGPPTPAFAGRPPGPPAPAFSPRPGAVQRHGTGGAFAAQPPGPPSPAFAGYQPVVQRHGAGNAFAVDSGALGLASGGGKLLPDSVRGKMEAALGADFSSVRVHVGPQAERIGAIAFTIGSDVYFAPGRYQPDTPHGQQLLGHELAHVLPQRQGRVRNPIGSGVAVVQDRALEAEADRLGQRAASHQVAVQAKMLRRAAQPSSPRLVYAPIIQRWPDIQTETGKYQYELGWEFQQKHVATSKTDAIAKAKSQYDPNHKEGSHSAYVTVIYGDIKQVTQGNDAKAYSNYDWAITIDVDAVCMGPRGIRGGSGDPGQLDENIGTVTLSGYGEGTTTSPAKITHVSTSI